ncbi:hypothetical protein [Geodermatophilus sp. SYSU D00710]
MGSELVQRYAAALGARDRDAFDHRPEPHEPPAGREHLTER